jgi:hypothetical protein
MLLSLLAAAVGAASPTAIDAERAFSADAQRRGQWTAARNYADPDAVMFTPQAVWARDFLNGRKDPRRASRWSPNASYVSCDGRLAVNTGPWRSADGRQSGFFTTVWELDGRKWHWVTDGRHVLKRPPPSRKVPLVRKGSCSGRAPGPPLASIPSTRPGPGGATPDDRGRGQSGDRTLGWEWRVGPNGSRQFRAYLWTGRNYTVALDQRIGG